MDAVSTVKNGLRVATSTSLAALARLDASRHRSPSPISPDPAMASQTKELQKELKKTTADAAQSVKERAASVQKELTETAADAREAAHKVFLAGLGAFATAEEEGSKLFKKLVKRGRKVEMPGLGADRVKALSRQLAGAADDAQDAVKARVDDAASAAGETADKIEDRLQEAVAVIMKRIGVPTRTEISELTASVERLTQHVESLKAEKAAVARAAREDVAAAKAEAAAAKAAVRAEKRKAPEVTSESVGGGWYEIRVSGVVVEKVQGKEDAESAVQRLQETRG